MQLKNVTSQDGTSIAYEKLGHGRALILIDGATASRQASRPLAQLLAADFSVYLYDRRGRGDSTDQQPYTVQKEVQDIAALIQDAGGSASLFGMSSGGALALEAAIHLGSERVENLALYEVPYDSSDAGVRAWHAFRPQLAKLLAARDHEGALTFFMQFVGAPEQAIEGMRRGPQWTSMVAMAPTLAYDVAVVGPDRVVPSDRAARIAVPTLIMDGSASRQTMPFMRKTAEELARAIPDSRRQTLEGQAHAADAKALAAALREFLGVGSKATSRRS